MVGPSDVIAVVSRLRMEDERNRKAALEQLRSWRGGQFEEEAAEALLQASAETFPAVRVGWPPEPNSELISVMWGSGPALKSEVIARHASELAGESKWAAVRLLVEQGTRESSKALADVIAGIGSGEQVPGWVLIPLQQNPRDPDVLVPALAQALEAPEGVADAAATLLSYTQAGMVSPRDAAGVADRVSPQLAEELAYTSAKIAADGLQGRWEEASAYGEHRIIAGLLLDLAGNLGVAELAPLVTQAANHADPWIALWGIVGGIRLGNEVDASRIEPVAADAETRVALRRHLELIGRPDLFPAAHWTQSGIAESDLVEWLKYPTELGRTPDDIEEVAVVPMRTEAGECDLYAFRFRTRPPHWAAESGWMLGVAGPYLRGSQPTMDALGFTFSRFEPFDQPRLREGIEAIVGTLDEWAGAQHKKKWRFSRR